MAFVIHQLVSPDIRGDISIAIGGMTDAAAIASEEITQGLFRRYEEISQLSERINRGRSRWYTESLAARETEQREVRALLESTKISLERLVIPETYPQLISIKSTLETHLRLCEAILKHPPIDPGMLVRQMNNLKRHTFTSASSGALQSLLEKHIRPILGEAYKKVFISYAWGAFLHPIVNELKAAEECVIPFVDGIYPLLRAMGLIPFLDRHAPTFSRDLWAVTEEAIREASAILMLFTPNYAYRVENKINILPREYATVREFFMGEGPTARTEHVFPVVLLGDASALPSAHPTQIYHHAEWFREDLRPEQNIVTLFKKITTAICRGNAEMTSRLDEGWNALERELISDTDLVVSAAPASLFPFHSRAVIAVEERGTHTLIAEGPGTCVMGAATVRVNLPESAIAAATPLIERLAGLSLPLPTGMRHTVARNGAIAHGDASVEANVIATRGR